MIIASDKTLIKESAAAIDADIRMFREAESMGGIAHVKMILNLRLNDPENSFFYALRNESEEWEMGNIAEWPTSRVEPLMDGVIQFDFNHELVKEARHSARPMSSHFDIMAKVQTFKSGHQLIVGRDVDDLEIAQWVGQTFGGLIIGVMLLISVTSIWVGFYLVSRFNRIAETADKIIETGNLGARIPVDNNWDDISKLSAVLNRLLDELEEMVKGMKAVSDNIAHDLRTPLTRLRNDIGAVKDKSIKSTLLAEADNILSIFNGLLRIADIESEKQRQAFELISLRDIAHDVVDMYRPLAEEKDIAFSFEAESASFIGDRDLIFQAFSNVIDNAIKFTPEEGSIDVTLRCTSDENNVVFSVKDTGIGICDSEKDKVIRRFYRVEKSRNQPGNGTGVIVDCRHCEIA